MNKGKREVRWTVDLRKQIRSQSALLDDILFELREDIEENGILSKADDHAVVKSVEVQREDGTWELIFSRTGFHRKSFLFEIEAKHGDSAIREKLNGQQVNKYRLDEFLPETFPLASFDEFFFLQVLLSEEGVCVWEKSEDWYVRAKLLGRWILNLMAVRGYHLWDGSLYLTPTGFNTDLDGFDFLSHFLTKGEFLVAQHGDRWVVEHNGTKWDLTGFSREMLTPDGATFPRYQP